MLFKLGTILVPTGLMRTFYLFFVEFRWPRNRLELREFIIGINEIVQLVTADEFDLSDNDLINEEDVIFLEEAMSDTDDTMTVTINDAHARSIKLNVLEPLSHLFYWRKICTSFDIPNCSLSAQSI